MQTYYLRAANEQEQAQGYVCVLGFGDDGLMLFRSWGKADSILASLDHYERPMAMSLETKLALYYNRFHFINNEQACVYCGALSRDCCHCDPNDPSWPPRKALGPINDVAIASDLKKIIKTLDEIATWFKNQRSSANNQKIYQNLFDANISLAYAHYLLTIDEPITEES